MRNVGQKVFSRCEQFGRDRANGKEVENLKIVSEHKLRSRTSRCNCTVLFIGRHTAVNDE
jgi:hypothetical protein